MSRSYKKTPIRTILDKMSQHRGKKAASRRFRRLATLLAFASAFASCRRANDPFMTSRLGTTEYYRWDIKSLDTVSIYNFRILDKGTFKVEEGIDTSGMAALKISGSGFGYLRIPCTDHLWPDPCDIDAFIDFIKCIDTDSVWMHFHCVAGRGRTGAFMCLYDMMKSPGVSYEDISDRQSALGASSMRVKHRNPAKPDEKADNNESVSRLLYQYVQENRVDGYKVSLTDWLSAHGE